MLEGFLCCHHIGHLQDVFDQKALQVSSIRNVPHRRYPDTVGLERLPREKEEGGAQDQGPACCRENPASLEILHQR